MLEYVVWQLAAGLAGYNAAHLMFTLKYWNLSFKIQAIYAMKDVEFYNKMARYLMYFLSFFLLTCTAIFIWSVTSELNIIKDIKNIHSIPHTRRLFSEYFAKTYAVAPCVFNLIMLADAFRRMRNTPQDSNTVVSLRKILSHIAIFVLICGCAITMAHAFHINGSNLHYFFYYELVTWVVMSAAEISFIYILSILIESSL